MRWWRRERLRLGRMRWKRIGLSLEFLSTASIFVNGNYRRKLSRCARSTFKKAVTSDRKLWSAYALGVACIGSLPALFAKMLRKSRPETKLLSRKKRLAKSLA